MSLVIVLMYILYCFEYYYLALHVRNMCKMYWFFKENEDIILNILSCFLLIHIKKLADWYHYTVLTEPNSPKLPLALTFLKTD